MASNTAFNPPNINEFDKFKMNKDGHGVLGVASHGTSTTLDYTLADDMIIAGGHTFLANGVNWGDYVEFQVVHPIAGVLLQFLSTWYLNPEVIKQEVPPSNYPAKLTAGLILRVVYHSTGSADVPIAVNYNLERVLV